MLSAFPFDELLAWYHTHGRHTLPWRDYTYDEKTLWYRVWLSEIMLQQTQALRVEPYFTKVVDVFPTIEDLAHTSYENFFVYYKWLGYYSRARNMLKTAQKVVHDFWGIFPQETSQLMTLPWVGPYTAEAIRAFVYNIPTLSFDTNLEKIFSRYYHGNRFQKLTQEEKTLLKTTLKYYVEEKNSSQNKAIVWNISRDINNALMDYWSIVSLNTVANMSWENYPLTSSKFYQTRGSLEPVQQKKISQFPTKEALIFTILHENHHLYFSSPDITSDCTSWTISEIDNFLPFCIGKNTWNPRSKIQSYFLKKYNLEVSVRPPEVRSYLWDGTPYLVSYAQIQSGTHTFQVFENITVRWNEEHFIEKIPI